MKKVSAHKYYGVWSSLHKRCYVKSSKDYPRYGGRGIKVCDRWRSGNGDGYRNFVKDVGERPPNPDGWTRKKPYYSLDRRDVNGDYSPENCYWSTWLEQNTNKRNNKPHPGVYRNGNNWEARYRPQGEFISKTFKTLKEAIEARKAMEMQSVI